MVSYMNLLSGLEKKSAPALISCNSVYFNLQLLVVLVVVFGLAS